MIDDHNVPTLQDMLRFAQSVKEWLNADPENVIVVHCKGIFYKTNFFLRFNEGQIISECLFDFFLIFQKNQRKI